MSVTTVPLVEDLQGPWRSFRVEFAGAETVELTTVYPFTSTSDLKRQIWIHKEGDPRWAPDRVFICVRSGASTSVRPVEFHWPANVTEVDLPDPTTTRDPNLALVDAAGVRKPVAPVMMGGLILESALSPEIQSTGGIPTVTVFSLADLRADEFSAAVFGGYYQLYFPWLTTPAQVIDSAKDSSANREAYAAAFPYIEDRNGRIELVQRALTSLSALGSKSVTMNTMVRLRWILPPPAVKPLSLERTFYGLSATETIPFIRYFPAAHTTNQAPLLKLALKADGSPVIDDAKLYTQFLNQPAPNIKSAVIMARIPLDHGTFFMVFMFESGHCDITLEVPQRGTTFLASTAAEAQRILRTVVTAIGFPPDTNPILKDIHATYKWLHPRSTAPLSSARIKTRVAAFTPFLEAVPEVKESKTPALATFQWRAVSNYESESAQFAYITQMVLRTENKDKEGEGADMLRAYGAELADRFGLTKEAAGSLLERWLERRGEAVAPVTGPGASSTAVPKFSTGASVSITGTHPEYLLEIQGVDSYEELQRLASVVSVLLGASSSDLKFSVPAPVIQAAAAAVAIADAVVADAGDEGEGEEEEMDPAMAALMADLGIGGGGEDFGEEAEEAEEGEAEGPGEPGPGLVIEELPIVEDTGPGPNLDAAIAAVEEECRGTPWAAGEPPLKITADYYMAKLKKEDKIMFGYSSSATGRTKTYSKSCQRRDDRQPNIMTLAEYARVQRCYEGRVRFANLPPRKPSDIPQDPAYTVKRRVPDDYYFTDPTPGPTLGWPLWSVYGYQNKSRPGEYLYLICAELWCDRDNLPLLPSEYEGTQGRGFTKPPMSCPFCRGTVIRDIGHPRSGESVIVRQPKGSTGKLHRYIGTITRNKHPNGYELPCCDTTPRLLEKYMKSAFLGIPVGDIDVDEPEPAPELGLAPAEGVAIDYLSVIGGMQTQYVLARNNSLSAGKIGLLPAPLDKFFGQDGPRSLTMNGIRPSFKPAQLLFVHLGVDTRLRAPGLNLFAGLAPLLNYESAEACRARILERLTARAFESANYGNLVHEFAAKSTTTEAELSSSLATFAGENGYNLAENRPHVIRLYKAWTAFLKMMADNRVAKQLRHLEHLLAQPRVIANRGLLLVTLELTGEEIKVVCPSFGIPTASLFGDVPVAFMWHDKRDESWEPIILYNGSKDATLFFDGPELSTLPEAHRTAIRNWLQEWRSSSMGCGRPSPPPHVWTPIKDTRDLPRLSTLLHKMEGYTPKTLVRDRSNRLAGLLFSSGAGTTPLFVPCLDDGNLAEEMPRVFEAAAIPLSPIESYLQFYALLSEKYKGLRPVESVVRLNGNQLIAFRVAGGALIPIAPIPTKIIAGLTETSVAQFPWERDNELMLKSLDDANRIVMEESTASVEEQAAEAYQYLRLTMSNWLSSTRDPRGPAAAAEIATILNKTIPLYEKRKRCDILLEPIIREWLTVEQTEERKPLSILREDCLNLQEESCDGVCSWSGGRCMIHVPTRSEAVDPVIVFTARLSDELLRYPSSRREILDQKVLAIRTPRGAVRIGDELLLATKAKESAETILERLGFFGQMAAQFPEEMLRFEGLEEEDNGPSKIEDDVEPEMEKEVESGLPPAWTEKGLVLADGGTKQESLARGTLTPIDNWETRIKKKRALLSLPGDPNRPVTWSIQDWYSLVRIVSSDILFVTQNADGLLKVSMWIKYNTAGASGSSMYMIFWNDSLVVRGKIYRFFPKDLPSDLATAMDAASPITDDEAKNDVDAPVPQLLVTEAKPEAKSEAKPEAKSEAKPKIESASESESESESESNFSEASPLLAAKKPEEPKPEEPSEKPGEPGEKPGEPGEKPNPGTIAQIASVTEGAAEAVGSVLGTALESLTLA